MSDVRVPKATEMLRRFKQKSINSNICEIRLDKRIVCGYKRSEAE